MRLAAKLFMVTRAWSFPMTVISVSYAAAYAYYSRAGVDLLAYILVVLGTLLLHAGVNVLNDYYDTAYGVDREGAPTTRYRLHPIIHGLVRGEALLRGGLASIIAGLLIAAYLVLLGGVAVLALGAAGAFLAYSYTGPPLRLKYRALGELATFLAWGPLMALGTYLVLTHGEWSWSVAAGSVPIGLLVSSVLLANNLRDIDFDERSGVKTLAVVLGLGGALKLYASLIAAAYVIQALLAALGLLPLLSLVTLVTALKAKRLVSSFMERVPEASDPMTAQLVLFYGVLYVAGTLAGALLGL